MGAQRMNGGTRPRNGRWAGCVGAAAACLLCAVSVVGEAGTTEPSVVVSIRQEARVRGPEIRLGEIADVAGRDPALIERLRAVEVARAPLPGLTRTLDIAYVKARLRFAKIDLAGLVLDAPSTISVTTASRQVGGEELVAAVREHVAAVRRLDAESLSVQPTGMLPPAVAVPDGRLELRVRTRPGSELAGTISPTVEMWVDGVLARSVSLSVRIGVLGDVLVAARALGRGHSLIPEDVRIERRDVTGPQEPLRDLAGIEGRITVRPIAQGESVLPSLLDRPPLVRRGDIVLVTAEGRGLRVTAQGEAKQDGKSGDVIRVRNLTSNRDVVGQVDGERSVRVQF